jgi:hemoglobin
MRAFPAGRRGAGHLVAGALRAAEILISDGKPKGEFPAEQEDGRLSETAANVSIYERIGGETAVDRLVEAFYDNMDALPQAAEVREMHGPELGEIRKVFRNYLTEWTGGPALYSPEKGHPRLRQRHLPFAIDDAARDAWMACMTRALDDTLGDTPARRELEGNIGRLADWMRNRQ